MVKHFFYVLFGGMAAIIGGVALAYAGRLVWQESPSLRQFKFSNLAAVASTVISQPTDGTSISGLRRSFRYSANEEEDLINAATIALPNIGAKGVGAVAYLVKNLETGNVSASRNPDKLLPIASLTKLVTAVIARQKIDPEDRVVITKQIMSTYGNTGQFKVNETLRAGDLIYPLLMVSSNDAAEALARQAGRAKFLAAMNDFAQSIGAYRTTFTDPSGLSPDNRSTVDDLALILEWIRKNDPEIITITNLKSKTVRTHTWLNPTHFLSWSNYLGGKNGYTDEANRTGAALFKMGDKKEVYAVVILGSSSRDQDMVKLLGKVK
ncbi:MAG: serine hydrolase [Candidatus Paceibacterota bacterium]